MITAVSNQRVKNIILLNQKAKARREQGVFVTEGVKMFLEAPIEMIREVYVSESFVIQGQIAEKLKQCSWDSMSDEVFQRAADTMTPQGILCIMKQLHYNKKELLQKKNALWVLLEDLQDPGNLGTIMRTGEGAGITGVILTKGSTDIYNPKTIRATMGSIYRVPFFYTEHLAEEIAVLKDAGNHVFAAHLEGKAYYDELEYTKGAAFLIGNEGNGLRRETADLADTYLRIPMEGQLESLNAAVAAAVLMYEANRQQRKIGKS